jgi:hypothetical protein
MQPASYAHISKKLYLSIVSVKTAPQFEFPLAKCPDGIQRVFKYYVRKSLIFQLSWVLYIIYIQKYKQQKRPAYISKWAG